MEEMKDGKVRLPNGLWIEKEWKKPTREEIIKWLEDRGSLVPGCLGCQERYEAVNPFSVLAPNHEASRFCESGKRNHCTCDSCF
jgi:hypothetical protein